jgi:hypothetical protein
MKFFLEVNISHVLKKPQSIFTTHDSFLTLKPNKKNRILQNKPRPLPNVGA